LQEKRGLRGAKSAAPAGRQAAQAAALTVPGLILFRGALQAEKRRIPIMNPVVTPSFRMASDAIRRAAAAAEDSQ
jgi:hypothetical protein